MPDTRTGVSTGSAVFWFALSVLVTIVNFRSAARGSWLALLLGLLAVVMAFRYGAILLERYRAARPARRR